MNKQKYSFLLVTGLIALSFLVTTSAFAQTNSNGVGRGMMNRGGQGPVISGTVLTVSGNTITVSAKRGLGDKNNSTVTTYTVDATNAKVTKNGTASTVSAIVVGDKLSVQGTITGTNIVAKNIRDGVVQPPIRGNGQPIVAGKITAISGNSITITNSSNVVYTVDVATAKLVVRGVTSPTISSLAVGDNVVVQGTVNGNNITASSVIDQKVKQAVSDDNSGNQKSETGMGGMMRGIGNFFKHMFGF